MSWFEKNQLEKLKKDIVELNRRSLFIEHHWSPRVSETAIKLEQYDIEVMKNIETLHALGKDVPAITTKIILVCQELKSELEKIQSEGKVTVEEQRIIDDLLRRIGRLFTIEVSATKTPRLIVDNAMVQDAKKRIMTAIQTKSWGTAHAILYDLLRTREEYGAFSGKSIVDLQQQDPKYNLSCTRYKEFLAEYEKMLKSNGMVCENDGWFHVSTAPQHYRLGISFKMYVTVDYASCWIMMQAFVQLAKNLQQISNTTKDNIQVKIPSSFPGFLQNADSIVVHYKKMANGTAIHQIVNGWMINNKIKNKPRLYGRTYYARDVKVVQQPGGEFTASSFSDHAAATATSLMKKMRDVSVEFIAITGINYAIRASRIAF